MFTPIISEETCILIDFHRDIIFGVGHASLNITETFHTQLFSRSSKGKNTILVRKVVGDGKTGSSWQ